MPTIPTFRTARLKEGDFARGLAGLASWPRVPAVLEPSGVVELDAVLGGGFPRGSLVELCGPASSGRTSLSLALLAEATQREEACAFVDVSDSLDPASLAAAGVDIRRLLWIRCGGDEGNDSSHHGRPTPATFTLSKFWRAPSGARTRNDVKGSALQLSAQSREKPHASFLWQHPRDQMRGIEVSIPSLMEEASEKVHREQVLVAQALLPVRGSQSSLGTQLHPRSTKPHSQEWLCYSTSETGKSGTGLRSAPLALVPSPEPEIDVVARCAGEQAEPDRQRPRRGENVRRRRFPWKQAQNTDPPPATAGTALRTKPWKRLEQALKTTDLLLHSGGWGVVVFDLGNISWVDTRRIPLSTWFRFQRIVESTPTILLLLGEEPCAKSCASLVLRCQRGQEKWSSAALANEAWSGIATFEGFEIQGKVVRSRRQLQPANSARWQTRTLWSGSF